MEHRMRAMLFPYSAELLATYKYRELLPVEVISVVSPKSWGYTGGSPRRIEGFLTGEHIVREDFERELAGVDCVILGSFQQYQGDPQIRDAYIQKIRSAGKKWIDLAELAESTRSYTRRLYCRPLPVPVLGIFGTDTDCGKLELMLKTAQGLRSGGYHVSMVSPNPQITLFGGVVYPEAFYADDWSEREKINLIRSFLYELVEHEQPDLLIVAAPHGLNAYRPEAGESEYATNGLLAQILIQGARPDINMFCANLGLPFHWLRGGKETLRTLTGTPTLAMAGKRIVNIPVNGFNEYKRMVLTDEMMQEMQKTVETELGLPFLDLDHTGPDELAVLVENAFSREGVLDGIL